MKSWMLKQNNLELSKAVEKAKECHEICNFSCIKQMPYVTFRLGAVSKSVWLLFGALNAGRPYFPGFQSMISNLSTTFFINLSVLIMKMKLETGKEVASCEISVSTKHLKIHMNIFLWIILWTESFWI